MVHSYGELREKYEKFQYKGYKIYEDEDRIDIEYDFEVPGLSSFAPSWSFPKINIKKEFSKDDKFKNMVFSLGLVELVSYWKIACPKKVVIKGNKLTGEMIEWWKRLYFNGLGEFYYTNNIMDENQNDFMDIICESEELNHCDENGQNTEAIKRDELKGCLIPIGGGKDSALTLDILKNEKETNYCYIINPRGATIQTYKAAGYSEDKVIAAKRTLDKNMLRLNGEGYLNGHTPFSAIVAFSSTIAAYINGIKYIVLSNESSANESTVEGSYVNHQYSKSFQFEADFHNYEKRYIDSGTYYFSLLRPLSEFQIAGHFAKCREYHDIFKSCNVGSKQDIWCGNCPKCLFVWLILSPFMEQSRLLQIFGRNIVNDETMLKYFEQLIGVEKEKPFECVGSRDEINASLCLTIKKLKGKEMPYLFDYYVKNGYYDKNQADSDRFYEYYDDTHLIPEKYERLLKERKLVKAYGEVE